MFILFKITLRMERIHFFLTIYYDITKTHSCNIQRFFTAVFRFNFCDYFHIFAENIDCGLVGCKGMFVTWTCFRNVSSLYNLL